MPLSIGFVEELLNPTPDHLTTKESKVSSQHQAAVSELPMMWMHRRFDQIGQFCAGETARNPTSNFSESGASVTIPTRDNSDPASRANSISDVCVSVHIKATWIPSASSVLASVSLRCVKVKQKILE
jgi:hypothetical protein